MAQDNTGRVRPLDLAIVQKHAFISGWVAARNVPAHEESDGNAAWVDYEPYEHGPLARIKAALEPAQPVGAWPDFIAPPKYENTCECWEDPRLPDFRVIWAVARQHGYSIGLHGSMKRDCDLIAAPWVDNPARPEELVKALCEALNASQVGEVEAKPVGRIAVTLQIDGYVKPIDLSIMPVSEDRSMDDTKALGAEWMREQAAVAIGKFLMIKTDMDVEKVCDAEEAIRAIPLPTDSDLLAEAMKLPEVASAFVACKIIKDVIAEGHDNFGDMVMHFMEAAEPASIALAKSAAKETP